MLSIKKPQVVTIKIILLPIFQGIAVQLVIFTALLFADLETAFSTLSWRNCYNKYL